MRTKISVGCLAIAILAGAFALGAGADAPSASEQAVRQSDRLAAAPAIESLNGGPYLDTYAEIKAHADAFAKDLPLPSPESLDDVGYAAAAQQGGTSADLLEFVMQHNVRCDWYSAALERPSDQSTREIVNEIPRWAGFRSAAAGGPVSDTSTRIAAALNRGDTGPLKNEVAGPNCNPLAAIRR